MLEQEINGGEEQVDLARGGGMDDCNRPGIKSG
jgi:hypothetical protein